MVSTTSSSTITTTTYVPTTITPPPITPQNPCPTYCSISAGTVNLFFWPTNEPYTYPSTYVDTHLDYTFTSPSVYMVVNTIFGYNTAGLAGPSGTSLVFALDLDQVSTMVPDQSVTRQLTLSDLGTDCPQMEAASVIATAAPDGRCDPILVAPDPVKSWASPCNACGAFGLFDPPYAVPPLTGGLVPGPTTTTMALPEPQTTTGSSTMSTVTETTAYDVAPTPTLTPLSSTRSVTISSSSLGSDPNSTTTPSMAAKATKVTGGAVCLILSFVVSVYLL
ncbi:hypothetical protein N7510_008113 [Penicillium lagena]|uniref:uncharacterized protein n=1 Tax=Penicillium lagena TaxID=94218 RepID=UPI002540D099|nr:uncharacterized protein N7510_008113 [Penicillium lagena]KAJ5611394.1 hypothetical protein N7510_008113 [Penicillium lagena]